MAFRLFVLAFAVVQVGVTISSYTSNLYQSTETGVFRNKSMDCQLFGWNLTGSFVEAELRNLSINIQNWTWINAYDDISPPFYLDDCYRGTHSGEPVDLNELDINQINDCLSKCTDNDEFYLSDTQCYCGSEGFNKNFFQNFLNSYSKQCDVDNLGQLQCGKAADNMCHYVISETSSTPETLYVRSRLWGTFIPGGNSTGLHQCITVKTDNFSSGILLVQWSNCNETHPFLCNNETMDFNWSSPRMNESLPSAVSETIISPTPHSDRITHSILGFADSRKPFTTAEYQETVLSFSVYESTVPSEMNELMITPSESALILMRASLLTSIDNQFASATEMEIRQSSLPLYDFHHSSTGITAVSQEISVYIAPTCVSLTDTENQHNNMSPSAVHKTSSSVNRNTIHSSLDTYTQYPNIDNLQTSIRSDLTFSRSEIEIDDLSILSTDFDAKHVSTTIAVNSTEPEESTMTTMLKENITINVASSMILKTDSEIWKSESAIESSQTNLPTTDLFSDIPPTQITVNKISTSTTPVDTISEVSNQIGAIVGGVVVASLVVIALAVAGAFFYHHKREKTGAIERRDIDYNFHSFTNESYDSGYNLQIQDNISPTIEDQDKDTH